MRARLILLTAVAAATLATPELDAQRLVQAGRGSVSTTVRVGLVIPPRLKFRATETPRLQQQRGDTANYVLTLEVAANLDWTLGVLGAAAAADAAPRTVRVKDHTGAWRTLDAAEPVTLVPARAPADWQPVRMEIQVIGRARVMPALTFDLQAAWR